MLVGKGTVAEREERAKKYISLFFNVFYGLVFLGLVGSIIYKINREEQFYFNKKTKSVEYGDELNIKMNTVVNELGEEHYVGEQKFIFKENKYKKVMVILIGDNQKKYYKIESGEGRYPDDNSVFPCKGNYLLAMVLTDSNRYNLRCINSY